MELDLTEFMSEGSETCVLVFHFDDPGREDFDLMPYGKAGLVVRAHYLDRDITKVVQHVPDLRGYFGEIRIGIYSHGADHWQGLALLHLSVDDVFAILESLLGGIAANWIYDKFIRGRFDKERQTDARKRWEEIQDMVPSLNELEVKSYKDGDDYLRVELEGNGERVVVEILGDRATLDRYSLPGGPR